MTLFISTLFKNSRGQVWGLDLVIATTIFLAGIIIFYVYAFNFSNEADENLNPLIYDGEIISDILLSEGSPSDWKEADVELPGLTSQNKINETKIERIYNLVNSDYADVKRKINTKYDFYFFFKEQMEIPDDSGNFIEGIGKSGVTRDSILLVESPENIIKITRFTVYRDKPTKLTLYLWD